MPDPTTYCGLCGAKGELRQTRCCGRTVCDDYESYRMFTYSRASCARNHDRYTLCCMHRNEAHDGDWKTCKECADSHKEWKERSVFAPLGLTEGHLL